MKELYKVSPSTGKMLVWWAEAVGGEVKAYSCEYGGKIKTSSYKTSSKNKGKLNATTEVEQAVVEVSALYKKQRDNKHYRDSQEEALEFFKVSKVPRKLHNYKDYSHKLPERCLSMVKYNGLRACVVDGELRTKAGRVEEIKIPKLKEAVLKMKDAGFPAFDSEVYAHGLSLQRIKAAFSKPVKTDKEIIALATKRKGRKLQSIEEAVRYLGYHPNEDADKLRFVVFDIPALGKDLAHRMELRGRFISKVKELNLSTYFAEAKDKWTHGQDSRLDLRDHVTSKGLEGLVHYCPTDTYSFDVRTYTAQKDKPRQTSEALVVGCLEDKSGHGVLQLKTNKEMGSLPFKAKMKGDAASRAYSLQKELIGSWVEYAYEELSDEGKPTKPVVLEERECDVDGKPIKH